MHKKSDKKLLNHLVYVFFRFSLEKFSLHFDFWEPTINSSYLITWDFLAIQTESNPIFSHKKTWRNVLFTTEILAD